MNEPVLRDDWIRRVFDRRAERGRVADDLGVAILATTAATRQRRGWSSPRWSIGRPAAPRIMAAVVLAGTVVLGAVMVAGGRPAPRPAPSPAAVAPLVSVSPTAPPPTPSRAAIGTLLPDGGGSATWSFPEFTYTNPRESGLFLSAASHGLTALTGAAGDPYGRAAGGMSPGAHGIIISAFDLAYVHPCPQQNGAASRIPVRTDPAGFLDDLGLIGGMGVVSPTQTTFDGRPALATSIDQAATRCDTADIHVPDADPDYALLTAPNRLIVSSVPQRTVLIVIWAATDDDLEAWLPTAMKFVDSIHIAQ